MQTCTHTKSPFGLLNNSEKFQKRQLLKRGNLKQKCSLEQNYKVCIIMLWYLEWQLCFLLWKIFLLYQQILEESLISHTLCIRKILKLRPLWDTDQCSGEEGQEEERAAQRGKIISFQTEMVIYCKQGWGELPLHYEKLCLWLNFSRVRPELGGLHPGKAAVEVIVLQECLIFSSHIECCQTPRTFESLKTCLWTP